MRTVTPTTLAMAILFATTVQAQHPSAEVALFDPHATAFGSDARVEMRPDGQRQPSLRPVSLPTLTETPSGTRTSSTI
jgi:hypothetical protein